MGDPNLVYTLDEALSGVGFGSFQIFLLAYGGLGWLAEAMEMMILSFVGPAVQSEWRLSPSEESVISTMVFVGMLLGAYLWSFISDTYGRKKGFLGAVMISTGAGILSAFSPNYVSLVILRGIAGIGLGGLNTFTIWFLEFVPTPNRGAWMVLFTAFWTLGTIFEAALAWIVMPTMGWRWLIALSAVPSVVVLLFYVLIPESPRFLCLKGRLTEAQNILERAALVNKTKLPNGMLVSDQTIDFHENFSTSEHTSLLSSTRKEASESSTWLSLVFLLFSSDLVRTTLLLWILYFGNIFAYYCIILLTSELSSGQSRCGLMNSLLGKSQDTSLYTDAFITSLAELPGKSQDTSLYTDVFITSLAELPGLVLSGFIVDRIGRKLSMVMMFALGFLLLLPLVIHQTRILTITLLFGARMFISAISFVVSIYAPEVYPTNIRTIGVGIASSMGRIGGMIAPLVAVGLVTSCHQTAAVMLIASVIILSGLSVLFFPFETRGRDLTDTV